MSKSEQELDRWQSCPPGTLSRTVRGINARQRDRRRAKFVGAAGGVVVLLFAAVIVGQQFGRGPTPVPNVRGITCAQLQTLLPAYLAGKLEAAVTGQVKTHLDKCPHCRELYKKGKDETALPGQRFSDAPQLAMQF